MNRNQFISPRIQIDRDKIKAFCQRWKIKEFSIFGSALREDFKRDSDVDVLVVFDDRAEWDLMDHLHAEDELAKIFGRNVDLIEMRVVSNPFRRHHILKNRQILYAA